MEIVDKDKAPEGEVISLKDKRYEKANVVTVAEVIEAISKQDLTDIVVVSRAKDGAFQMSISAENGMMAYFMVKKACFAMEHSIL